MIQKVQIEIQNIWLFKQANCVYFKAMSIINTYNRNKDINKIECLFTVLGIRRFHIIVDINFPSKRISHKDYDMKNSKCGTSS